MPEKRIRYYCALIMILMFIFANAYGEMMDLDIMSGIPVLDNTSYVNLPYRMITLDESLIIDSFHFAEPESKYSSMMTFNGNIPLSMNAYQTEAEFKGALSPSLENTQNRGIIKVFPYSYDGAGLITYRKLELFTHRELTQDNKAEPAYDYLIICTAKYDTCFERLLEWKTMKGLRTKLYTTEHIESLYAGADRQERIRNFIKSEYAANHFTYLLLGGDSTQIPVRKMYALTCGAGYYPDEDSIPADIYYSNLDGDFDFDNDGTYGELSDSADLIPEVYVGRILFDTIVYQPGPVVTKIIDYEKTAETEHLERGMFLGMVLWNPPYSPGGKAKDRIADDIIPDYYHNLKFYESEGHTGDADILDSLDTGYSIINHNGHGSFKGIWVDQLSANNISRGDASVMANGNKTGLFYSVGCWVGAFDRDTNGRNFAQCLQSAPYGGCIAIICNSRYGWGAPGYPGWGVSDMFDYQYFKMLFESDNKELGKLLAEMKIMYEPLSKQENLYRWHQYQLNFFGDPNMSLYTRKPDTVDVKWRVSGNSVNVYASVNGVPAQGLLAALSNDSVIDRNITDASGFVTLTGDTADTGMVYLCITGANAVTFIDSLYLSYSDSLPDVFPYQAFTGSYADIELSNRHAFPLNFTLNSSQIDTQFTLNAVSDSVITYYCSSFNNADTLFVTNGTDTDTYYLKISRPELIIDSFEAENGMYALRLMNTSEMELPRCSVNLGIHNRMEYVDTMLHAINDSFMLITGNVSLPDSEDYILMDVKLYMNDTIVSLSRAYADNTLYTFIDDFSQGLGKWENIETGWHITDSMLHCGNDSTYSPSMNQSISSFGMTILPGSVCSMKVKVRLPTLEFTPAGPVFDLDGMFVSLAQDNDTSILDFISSGGALESKVQLDAWKTYIIEQDSVISGNILLTFISDDVIQDSGVFIDSLLIRPAFHFVPEDTILDDSLLNIRDILRYGPPVTDMNPVYFIPGLDNEVTMRVYSLNGRILSEKTVNRNEDAVADLRGLPSGVYFIRFESGNLIYKDKIIYLR